MSPMTLTMDANAIASLRLCYSETTEHNINEKQFETDNWIEQRNACCRSLNEPIVNEFSSPVNGLHSKCEIENSFRQYFDSNCSYFVLNKLFIFSSHQRDCLQRKETQKIVRVIVYRRFLSTCWRTVCPVATNFIPESTSKFSVKHIQRDTIKRWGGIVQTLWRSHDPQWLLDVAAQMAAVRLHQCQPRQRISQWSYPIWIMHIIIITITIIPY